jgi:hypothetical protein
MRAKKAKFFRKVVYGDLSYRNRTYARHHEKRFVVADQRRRVYQAMKKLNPMVTADANQNPDR